MIQKSSKGDCGHTVVGLTTAEYSSKAAVEAQSLQGKRAGTLVCTYTHIQQVPRWVVNSLCLAAARQKQAFLIEESEVLFRWLSTASSLSSSLRPICYESLVLFCSPWHRPVSLPMLSSKLLIVSASPVLFVVKRISSLRVFQSREKAVSSLFRFISRRSTLARANTCELLACQRRVNKSRQEWGLQAIGKKKGTWVEAITHSKRLFWPIWPSPGQKFNRRDRCVFQSWLSVEGSERRKKKMLRGEEDGERYQWPKKVKTHARVRGQVWDGWRRWGRRGESSVTLAVSIQDSKALCSSSEATNALFWNSLDKMKWCFGTRRKCCCCCSVSPKAKVASRMSYEIGDDLEIFFAVSRCKKSCSSRSHSRRDSSIWWEEFFLANRLPARACYAA